MVGKRYQGADRQRAYLGLTVPELTAELERRSKQAVNRTHVRNALNGKARPSAVLREHLPSILGLSLEACFDANALRQPYALDEKSAGE